MIPTTPVLAESLDLVSRLVRGTRLWSAGGRVGEDDLAELRRALHAVQHRRHLATIPAYAQVAADLRIDPDGLGPDGGVFLLSDDWLGSGDSISNSSHSG